MSTRICSRKRDVEFVNVYASQIGLGNRRNNLLGRRTKREASHGFIIIRKMVKRVIYKQNWTYL